MNLYTASAEVQTEVSKTPQIPTATAESMVITEPDTTEAEATTSHRLISIWDGEIDDSFEEGLGTLEYPYVIASAAQLAYFANYVNSGQAFEGEHYILSCDVSLVERPWTPIGTHEHPFSGFFWGCSSTVSDIDVGEGHRYIYEDNRGDDYIYEYMGLFGYVEDAHIDSLRIQRAYLQPELNNSSNDGYNNTFNVLYMGAIAGHVTSRAKQTVISNCIVDGYSFLCSRGSLLTGVECSYVTGGIVGSISVYGQNVVIRDCVASGDTYITSLDESSLDESTTGGIAGEVARSSSKNRCQINSCLALGQIIIKDYPRYTAGGICGRCRCDFERSYSERGIIIDNCVAGTIIDAQSLSHYAGGLIGESKGTTISNCIYLKHAETAAKKAIGNSTTHSDERQVAAYPVEAFLDSEKYNMSLGPFWMSSKFIRESGGALYLDKMPDRN
ncbi:MAG: hypothetical protein IJR95_07060 [Lachnospiraceae bacterium]|nr:hypothetical protein [Lachnospiraceae bacterium]